jgi:hypothetical protein
MTPVFPLTAAPAAAVPCARTATVENKHAAAIAAPRSKMPRDREAVNILEFTVFLLVNSLTLTNPDWLGPLPGGLHEHYTNFEV